MTITKEITVAANDRVVEGPEAVHFNISVAGYGILSTAASFGDTTFKRLFDTTAVSEPGFTLAIDKLLLESLLIEELGFARDTAKPLVDQLAMAEELAKTLSPATVLETVTATELLTLLPTKDLLEVITASETFVKAVSKVLTDTTTLTESGVIQLNNYVDLSYMDSLDYVNTKQTF